jgi:hypothetical protein
LQNTSPLTGCRPARMAAAASSGNA